MTTGVSTIGRMDARLLSDGFRRDELGNAVRSLGSFPSDKYSDVRGYISHKRRDGWPVYVVLAEIRNGMKGFWKRGSKFEVPAGSVMAVYETVGTHKEGYFNPDAEPVEGDDEAKEVKGYLF